MNEEDEEQTQTGEEDPYKELRSTIGSKGLKCGHININGLLEKIEEIRLLIKSTCLLDILAVTESHLDENDEDKEVKVENYLFHRQDRKNQNNHWGGTLIYYKDHFDFTELDQTIT